MFRRSLLVIAGMLVLMSGTGFGQKPDAVELSVAVLNDPMMPGMEAAQTTVMLEEARTMLLRKFGIRNLWFVNQGVIPVDVFFRTWLKKDSEDYKTAAAGRYIPYTTMDWKPYESSIMSFLRQWKVWDLAEFFPEKKQDLKTYEQIVPELMGVYESRLKALEAMNLSDGRSLIRKPPADSQSYVCWNLAMREQDRFDVVVCNSFIIYDDFRKPYPHAVTRFAKVGGSSFDSPKRPDFGGVSAMVNLFEMLTDIPAFQSKKSDHVLTPEERARIVGGYILAHELGHMIYLIPDVYNHDKGCLMDSSAESMDYYEGYQDLLKYSQPCSVCQAWVTARNSHFDGDRKFRAGDFAGAAEDYRVCVKTTPHDLDTDYNRYISLVGVKAARAYLKAGDRQKAKFYAEKAAADDPSNPDAAALILELK